MNLEASATRDEEYGGLIETMYKQYSEEEIPEKIKNLKDRIDCLFSLTPFQLYDKLKSFSEEERNYLNSKLLDDFFKIYTIEKPLEEAIKNNMHEKIINYYIECNICGYNFYFILAVEYGNLFAIKKLLLKVSEDIINRGFRYACFYGYLEIVNFLFENGATVNSQHGNAIIWASERGHISVVLRLLEIGADIHAQNDYAFRLASSNGHLEIVKLLLEKGADVHAVEDDALIWAFRNSRVDVIDFLLEKGANIHANNDEILVSSTGIHVAKVLEKYIQK